MRGQARAHARNVSDGVRFKPCRARASGGKADAGGAWRKALHGPGTPCWALPARLSRGAPCSIRAPHASRPASARSGNAVEPH